MANNKHRGTPAQLLEQKKRTYKNQAERYARLLEKYPTNAHAKRWKILLDFYTNQPSK